MNHSLQFLIQNMLAVSAGTLFNISGSQYRLIEVIVCQMQMISISDVLTHAEGKKDKWKGQC